MYQRKGMNKVKAIILAGGTGSRLHPLTSVACKQLLPIYDKPAIYYSLSNCLLAGIRDILIISTPDALPIIKEALKDGGRFGCSIDYAVQKKANGIAEALLIGEDFLDGFSCFLVLGDNLIFKSGYTDFISNSILKNLGATVFGFPVKNPSDFGVINLDPKTNHVLSLEEKPKYPKSNIAAIGMYIYDNTASKRAKELKPSDRGELEITDLNNSYLKEGKLSCQTLSRGDFWADVGTFESMNDCSNFIRLHQEYASLLIGAPEECAYRMGYISKKELVIRAKKMPENFYSKMLRRIAEE